MNKIIIIKQTHTHTNKIKYM